MYPSRPYTAAIIYDELARTDTRRYVTYIYPLRRLLRHVPDETVPKSTTPPPAVVRFFSQLRLGLFFLLFFSFFHFFFSSVRRRRPRDLFCACKSFYERVAQVCRYLIASGLHCASIRWYVRVCACLFVRACVRVYECVRV